MKKTLLGLACLALASCGGGSSKNADLAMKPTEDLAGGDAAVPAGFLLVESCAVADYVDGRADATKRVVTPWDTSLGKLCIHITAGQSVSWDGVPNPSHPLEAHGNGTTPNPITNVASTTFSSAGVFGYDCEVHHSLMHGAIWVDAQ